MRIIPAAALLTALMVGHAAAAMPKPFLTRTHGAADLVEATAKHVPYEQLIRRAPQAAARRLIHAARRELR